MKKVSVTMSVGSRLTAVWIACQLVGGLAQQPFSSLSPPPMARALPTLHS